ncbi:MAG: hypothetical protein CVU47_07310 [Chloroflexi bacterium HGW-Chloroflexi-9]|nr:MAG: hypothetical protein CVU47_07310 [Chloroflexi bacterium HGW-Chloroflexi-9]
MKAGIASFGSAFMVVASLTVLPVVIALLGGVFLTAFGAGFTFWRAQRRRRAATRPAEVSRPAG